LCVKEIFEKQRVPLWMVSKLIYKNNTYTKDKGRTNLSDRRIAPGRRLQETK
jgi:hypothetical protein